MADVVEVSGEDEFVREIVSNSELNLSDDGASELWRVWTYRYENGATDDVLVALPSWFAQEEFDKNRPYFFASIEHDGDGSNAVLFSDARLIDVNLIENQLWDDVTITKMLEVVDITETNDYVDEKGHIWIPRSLMTIYERGD